MSIFAVTFRVNGGAIGGLFGRPREAAEAEFVGRLKLIVFGRNLEDDTLVIAMHIKHYGIVVAGHRSTPELW